MDNVKAIADAGQDMGSVTRAFKESYQQSQREKVSAFQGFTQKLLNEGAKEMKAELDDALREVSKAKQGFLNAIRHQEKLLAEETAKKEREMQEQYARATFDDCEEDSIEKALQFIGTNKSGSKGSPEKCLELWRDYAQLFMGSIDFEPNKR